MTRSVPNRRGFVLIMAIAMIALVAVTLAVLTRHFAYTARRTRQAGQDAQLRQLLLAGAQDVKSRSADWQASPPDEPWKIDLPPELATTGSTLSVEPRPADGDNATLLIEARTGERTAVQTLTLRRTSGRWTIAEARLGAESRG